MRALVILLLVAAFVPTLASAQLSPQLSNERAVTGLKAALDAGVTRATQRLGARDGYLANALFKIVLPDEARSAAELVQRTAAGRRVVSDLITRMNRAAEAAAAQPETRRIFGDAIRSLTLTDGLTLLRGDSTAATRLLQGRTQPQLTELYTPVVRQQLTQAGVDRAWRDFANLYNRYAFVMGRQNLPADLSQHVTTRALVGLHTAVGQEEAKIRRDPVARTTDILRDVFGGIFR